MYEAHLLMPLAETGQFVRQHLNEVCVGVAAVTLMLIGPAIKDAYRKSIRKFHWIARYGLMIILITIGFGTLSNIIYAFCRGFLLSLNNVQLSLLTGGIFLVLGWVARNERKI
jgi:hypothetical protein